MLILVLEMDKISSKTHVHFTQKQGNSVARYLPPTGSEANTTIFVLYILDIDSHCPIYYMGKPPSS